MKRLVYISVFSLCTLVVAAQNKKGNTNTGGTGKPNATSEKEAISGDKDLTNYLLTKFSASDKVEFDDIKSALTDADAVTSLNLRKQGLTEIPDLSRFKNLTELDLSDNELGDFSGKLSGLSSLQSLDLSGNKLTTIPSDICNLKNLTVLNLSGNKITSGSLSCAVSIERLFLNNNQLTSIPAGVTEMTSLKALYLHSNNLATVDDKLAKMANLEVLLLHFNKITMEPEAFKNNSIIYYVFQPQATNPRALYKFMSGAGAAVHTGGAAYSSSSASSGNGTTEENIFALNANAANEIVENEKYNIKSIAIVNDYRKIKIGQHDYRKLSKARVFVVFPLGFVIPYVNIITGLHFVLSKKFRNNYRLSKLNYWSQRVDRLAEKVPTAMTRYRINRLARCSKITYKRYLRNNGLQGN